MNKFLIGFIFSILAGTALAGPERDPPVLPPNLAFDIDAPGAVRAEVAIAIPSLKEVQRYEFSAVDGAISGGVYAAPGTENLVSVAAFDANGEPIYRGEGYVVADKEFTRQIDIQLSGPEMKYPPIARLGTWLLTMGIVAGPGEGVSLTLKTTLIDAAGNHVPFKPDDLEWTLPEGFELLPYSCFLDSLCIEIPDRTNPDLLACYMNITCQSTPPPDRRGPYRFVSVGKNHTCAITFSNDLRCWGDNQFGQLGAVTNVCPASNKPCSLVPVPVECSPGESCKYRWVSAGGDHTCAIDTNGNAWCWGEEGSFATGAPVFFLGPDDPTHRHIPAGNNFGRADLVAIDTNIGHTCALSSANDVYCWGNNNVGQLGFPSSQISGTTKATFTAMRVPSGNSYKSIATGQRHSCAVQTNGLLDCWGDNIGRQIYNTNLWSFFGNAFATVTSKVPLLLNHPVSMVAGGFNHTCAPNAANDLVCWGAPDGRGTSVTSGFVAMPAAFAVSLATENDFCFGTSPFLDCVNTCVVDQWGTLSCGQWKGNSRPYLKEVPDPKADHHVMYSQVDVGENHTCVVTTHRDVWCFGLNTFGQSGTGTFSASRTFEPLTPANR